MKVFLDTSTLFKRYIEEPGSDQLDKLLMTARTISISPITRLELFSALARRLRERSIKPAAGKTILEEIDQDIPSFDVIEWNEKLEKSAIDFIAYYHLKTLDAIQLGAGHLSCCDIFATSDQTLAKAAQKRLKKVVLV